MGRLILRNGELTVDEYMADLGIDMLHPGGMKRTEELAEMCKITGSQKVLDVGCGYGKTACYLVRKYGCRVTGIDISKKMIEGSKIKVKHEGVEDFALFEIGNAENIRFKDATFDVVISEGTTVMLVEKEQAIREYLRVTKPGGYIGLNELSWQNKPTEEIIDKTLNTLQRVKPLEYEEWIKLMVDSGLKDIVSKKYVYKSTSWDTLSSLGLPGLIKVGIRYLTNSELRNWIRKQEALFRDYSSYWGYGLYVGRKST
jgi:ubiquinone/menaquinone biosynthesis C-methylase UbiE